MNFFPVGPLVRRSGVFFIRRSFKDNPVYKFVLRHYIDYLIEKRFSLEWYIEGGRSRSGKLLPPRFGLLAYVVDAYRRGKSEDVLPDPGVDRLRPDPGRRRLRRRAARRRQAARELRLVPAAWCAACAAATATSTSASASRCRWRRRSGRPDPHAAPNPDEQNLDAAEARLRGRGAHQPRDADHADLARDARAARHRRPRAHGLRGASRRCVNLLHFTRRAACRRPGSSTSTPPRACAALSTRSSENGVVSCFAEGAEPVYRSAPDQHLHRRLLPQHHHPLLRERRDRRAGAAARGRGRAWRSRRGVLGRGDAPARPAQVRVLLRGEGDLPRRAARELALHDASGSASSPRAARRSGSCCAASGRSARTASCDPSSRRTASSATRSSGAIPRGRSTSRPSSECLAARPPVPSPAPHPQRGVRLAGAVPRRRPGSRATAACSTRGRRISRSAAAPSPTRSARPCAASTRSTRWRRAGARG